MKYENRYEKLRFLQRFIAKNVEKIKKAAPRFELGIKDLQSSALPLGHAATNDPKESLRYNNRRKPKSLLIVCNGHGEDIIALEIIKGLLEIKIFSNIEVMPLVGNGSVFDEITHDNFQKIGFQQVLPSGGFSNQSLKALILDLKAGMFWYLLKNFYIVLRKIKDDYNLIAIGDLVPLFFAWFSSCEFGFIGTPKSDYTWMHGRGNFLLDSYHKCKGTEWDPWEIYLMKSSLCKFVLVRDKITSRNLKKKKIDAKYLGNPMMDFIKSKYAVPEEINLYKKIIVLIGSRYPEAHRNLEKFLSCLDEFEYKNECLILVPLSPNSDLSFIENQFKTHNFIKNNNAQSLLSEESNWSKDNLRVLLGRNKFEKWATVADVGLANAGTATEQISGLGIPALSFPGDGPQFTKHFAKRQQRLLGDSIIVCEDKTILVGKLINLLDDIKLRKEQGKIAMLRMGKSGASKRIVNYIKLKWSSL